MLGAAGVARGGAGSLAGAGRDSEPPHCEPDLAKMSVLSRIVLKDTHFHKTINRTRERVSLQQISDAGAEDRDRRGAAAERNTGNVAHHIFLQTAVTLCNVIVQSLSA